MVGPVADIPVLVCLGWIFFRASSFHNAVGGAGPDLVGTRSSRRVEPVVVAVVVRGPGRATRPGAMEWPVPGALLTLSIWAQSGALAGVLILIDLLGPAGVPPFIYFRF